MLGMDVHFAVDIEDLGKVVLALSRAKALRIINELSRLVPLSTYVYVRHGVPFIYLGIGKGGMMKVSCSRGRVLYDISQDSLMICLCESNLSSRRYLDVGYVAEGLDLLEALEGRRRAVIRRI